MNVKFFSYSRNVNFFVLFILNVVAFSQILFSFDFCWRRGCYWNSFRILIWIFMEISFKLFLFLFISILLGVHVKIILFSAYKDVFLAFYMEFSLGIRNWYLILPIYFILIFQTIFRLKRFLWDLPFKNIFICFPPKKFYMNATN